MFLLYRDKNNRFLKQKPILESMTKRKKAVKKAPKEQKQELLPKVNSEFILDKVITENSDDAKELFNQGRYGCLLENGRLQLSLIEASYLLEKKKIDIQKTKNTYFDFDSFIKKAKKLEPNFWIRYCVFKDIRNRGYILKTALKFGADFRVYDRGIKPGEDHAKWVVYPVYEGSTLTWHEFAAKNRVAHSTRKRLLIAVVDDENDVSYWEVKWTRP